MIICPSCHNEIPSDSIFCDQCGTHLKECPQCHQIVISNFCSKCGKPTFERKENNESVEIKNQNNNPQNDTKTAVDNKTNQETEIIITAPTLKLQHEGITLNISDGDILGRTTGAHVVALSGFRVISSKHAKIELKNKEWFITDLHSTNHTFLNGHIIDSDKPSQINDSDIITLANVDFNVIIK